MSEFDQFGQELHQARADKASAQRRVFESDEKIKQLKVEQAQLERTLDPSEPEHQRRRAELERKLTNARAAAEEARGALAERLDFERNAFERFGEFTDPRRQITNLNDQYPILLMPLRIETRWRLQERQLWVRVYPDDCAVDSFEPTLSETEVQNAQRFWVGMWQAGGVEDQQRAAWRGLVASHSTGRAAWIIQQYRPLDAAEPAKADPTDVILVIPTTQANPAEKVPLAAYWRDIWLADDEAGKIAAARSTLNAAVGQARAQALIEQFQPANLSEKPQGKKKSEVQVSVEFLHFPAPDDTATKRHSWSQPAKVNVMPDRLVLMGYQGDTLVINELGNLIPSPLVLTPDPAAAPADQLRAENGDLIVSEEMRWLVDFERAVEVGMGFKIDLRRWNERQWQQGFDRLIVLGVRLSADPQNSKNLFQTLIQNHHYSAKGFSLLPQGTATNNTENSGAGFSRSQDADETFDNYVQNQLFFNIETDWSLKRDGQWLAECLGLDYAALNNVPHADGTDQAEAMAMNTALFPATLGYMLRTLLKPALRWDQVDEVRWFFRHFVSGRGQVPAIRIGSQPYGILPTTVYSRMQWFFSDALPSFEVGSRIESARTFLNEINNIIGKLRVLWQTMAQEAPYVGKQPGDAHKTLLSILGLHPLSVEYHSRIAQSEAHLYNQQAFQGQAVQFAAAFQQFVSAGNEIAGEDVTLSLLRMLGYQAPETPDLLKLIFNRNAQRLKGAVIDDRPLSETELICAYALPAAPGGPQRNYLQWLVDAANTSLETLRIQPGFIDDKTPTALLYLVLRYALMQGYWKTGIEFHRAATQTHLFDVEGVRAEPRFIHVQQQDQVSESRFAHLYVPLNGVTNPDDVNDTLATAIPRFLWQEEWAQTANLREEIRAVQALVNVPTARLERLFAEHIDICSYRLDAWQQALVCYQLAAMRRGHYNPQNETLGGVYLGMYGWLENVRSENKVLTPVELPGDLREVFDPPRDGERPQPPIRRDSQNGGYIHAPSLNHAVTAAVLRNGYTSANSDDKQKPLAVNLSSERVRLALSFIEGIRGGQSLSALLGYQLERGLHDRGGFVEVDEFIYQLRKAFPLQANKLKLPIDPTTGAADPDAAPIEAQEARNVVDGLALVNHVNRQTGANKLYPFGKDLLRGSVVQEQAINQEVNHLLDIHDALADLALAEGVHQVVQGNYDRAAATMDAYSRGNFPPIPDVIQTPRTGITLVHRVAVHLEAGLSWNSSPLETIAITPRSTGEPAINQWLASLLPAQPADVVCKVVIINPTTNQESPFHVSWEELQLQPLDLLYLIQPENQQAMTELDDRILRHVIAQESPRPDAKIEIKYTDRVATKFTFFDLVPLMRSLRSLVLSSRPLQATDVMLTDEAKQARDEQVFGDKTRIDQVQTTLDQLRDDLADVAADLTTQLDTLRALKDEQVALEAEKPTATPARVIQIDTRLAAISVEREAWLANIDTWIANTIELLVRASSFGIPQTGWGFAYAWKTGTFSGMLKQVDELVKRWDDRLTEFDTLMVEYTALPVTTPDDERFRLLRRAEALVSTQATDPLPPTPLDLHAAVMGKRLAFDNKRAQFEALLMAAPTSLNALLSGIKALLPIDAFDKTAFDIATTEQQIVTFVGDMQRVLQGVANDADKRLKAAEAHLTAYGTTAGAKAQANLLKQAAVALLGEGFPFTPEFKLTAEQGAEWDKAYNAGKNGDLLKYQMGTLKVDFPIDDWLYGVARVRQKLHAWEQVVMLAGAFQRSEPELLPLQLPYHDNDSWLALQYPDDPNFVVDSERLLYTAYYPAAFNKSTSQCGLLLDEWTEVLPMEKETTGIAFHYDRPNSEPPQVMLLVTPPAFTGSWQWADLIDTLHETFALARQRAVEPAQVDATSLNRLLPATLMALTLREVSISGNLSINNKVLELVRRSER